MMSSAPDEIDFRPYVLAVIRSWWLILIFMVIPAIFFYSKSYQQPAVYQSTASIIISRSRPELTLTSQFPTVSDPTDYNSRINTIVTIIESDQVVTQVQEALKSKGIESELSLSNLRSMISLSTKGDIILLSIADSNKEHVSIIANTWAETAVSAINSAYKNTEPLSVIQGQRDGAYQDYQKAQQELEKWITGNKIAVLQAEIEERTALLTQESKNKLEQIDYYRLYKAEMEDTLTKMQALQEQIKNGTLSSAGSIGDTIAVLTARSIAFGLKDGIDLRQSSGEDEQSVTLNRGGADLGVQVTEQSAQNDSPESLIADINSISQLAAAEIEKADLKIQELSNDLVQAERYDNYQADRLKIQELQQELESEQAVQRELTGQRDVAWSAYQAIVQKETETKNQVSGGNTVNIVAEALVPEVPFTGAISQNRSIFGAFAGLILSLILILGREWFQQQGFTKGLLAK